MSNIKINKTGESFDLCGLSELQYNHLKSLLMSSAKEVLHYAQNPAELKAAYKEAMPQLTNEELDTIINEADSVAQSVSELWRVFESYPEA